MMGAHDRAALGERVRGLGRRGRDLAAHVGPTRQHERTIDLELNRHRGWKCAHEAAREVGMVQRLDDVPPWPPLHVEIAGVGVGGTVGLNIDVDQRGSGRSRVRVCAVVSSVPPVTSPRRLVDDFIGRLERQVEQTKTY